jgi:DNA-binding response OmpR family regulator
VDEGLPQVGAAGQGGLSQPERPVDPLSELLLVARACGRLDHQGHGYVIGVGIFVLGTGIEAQGRIMVIDVSEQLLRRGRFRGTVPQRFLEVIVLDIMLPGLAGVGVWRELRRKGNRVPVIMLTARDTPLDKVHSLDTGADDYLTKPFSMEELLARIRALLRRVEGDEVLRVNDLELNTATREVKRGKRKLNLTLREYELLEFMARNPRRVLSRDLLLSRVWGQESGVETNVVDVYVAYLRKKLEAPGEPKLIQTVRGVGYALRGE